MSLPPQLAAALEALYTTFAPYRPAGRIKHSPLKPHDDVAPLETKPLRQLTAEDFSGYSGAAVWTIGTAKDFKYFFPRMAELALHEEVGGASWASWASRLAPTLTPAERPIVQDFFSSLWQITLTSERSIVQIELIELLYALPFLFEDLEPLLRIFLPCPSLTVARQLKYLYHYGQRYSSPSKAHAQRVAHWLAQHAPQALAQATQNFGEF